jgi:Iap family predicted aminopeptidase
MEPQPLIGAVMQRLLLLMLACGALAANAQNFVCGSVSAAKSGTAQLTVSSIYTADMPDFDPSKPDTQATFHLPATPTPSKTVDLMKIPQI